MPKLCKPTWKAVEMRLAAIVRRNNRHVLEKYRKNYVESPIMLEWLGIDVSKTRGGSFTWTEIMEILLEQNKKTAMSEYPNIWVNEHWDDSDWEKSDKDCPLCKDVRMWQGSWYDDSPEMGGACIGKQFYCGNCEYAEFE